MKQNWRRTQLLSLRQEIVAVLKRMQPVQPVWPVRRVAEGQEAASTPAGDVNEPR